MREPDDDAPATPEIERDLDQLDRLLAGGEPAPGSEDLALLVDELSAERPTPDPEWASQLDEGVRDGFDRPDRGALGRLGARLGARASLRSLAFGGAAVGLVVAVVVATAVIQLDGGPGTPESSDTAAQTTEATGDAGSSAAAPGERGGLGGGAGGGASQNPNALEADPGGSTPLANRAANRKQDRDAQLELQTATDEVRGVSDRAIGIVESSGGVVVESTLSEQRRRDQASARLRLEVPSSELDGTLDQLTDLATVGSLTEAATDITEPFVSARRRLADARDERRSLLQALGRADDGDEADSLRRQVKRARRQIARREARFQRISQRARTSQVDLSISGSPAGERDDGSWSLSEAADDALAILRTAAGVLLVGAAVLVPLAVLAAIAAFAYAWSRSRLRERALDGAD